MVKGIERFRQHFRGYDDAFVIIGGAACDAWLSSRGTSFRPTRDLDVVLVVEALNDAFIARWWSFVKAGRYRKRERADGKRIYYRFQHPEETDYPAMLELFSRPPRSVSLEAGAQVTPIPAGEDVSSLSAIILDDDYYRLIMGRREMQDGLPMVGPACLIPLKMRAWLDLSRRSAEGERVDAGDIRKHRNDVFRLAMYLPGTPSDDPVAGVVREDMQRFLTAFAVGSPEWTGVLASLSAATGTDAPAPADLIATLVTFFGLTP